MEKTIEKKRLAIKFAKKYLKILDDKGNVIKGAKLLAVMFIPTIGKLNQHFIDYDTDNGAYKLNEDKGYLMLIFLKPRTGKGHNLFTTMRTSSKDKYYYYKKNIGNVFNIEITD